MNLRHRNGIVELVFNPGHKLMVSDDTPRINDGKWHHIIATMPSNKCSMADIDIYVDGIQRLTTFVGSDSIVDFPRGGMLAIGGFGYGGTSKGTESIIEREGFRAGGSFIGAMDDVLIYTRTIEPEEAQQLAGLTLHPSTQPSSEPSAMPTLRPSYLPSNQWTSHPSSHPSSPLPTDLPTIFRDVSEEPTKSLDSQSPSTVSPTLLQTFSQEPTKSQHAQDSITTNIHAPTSRPSIQNNQSSNTQQEGFNPAHKGMLADDNDSSSVSSLLRRDSLFFVPTILSYVCIAVISFVI